jgi:hypothetical protein
MIVDLADVVAIVGQRIQRNGPMARANSGLK